MMKVMTQQLVWALFGMFFLVMGSLSIVSAAPAPPSAHVIVTCGNEQVSVALWREDFYSMISQHPACDDMIESLSLLAERVEAWYSSGVWDEWNRADTLRFEPYSAERLTEINDKETLDDCLFIHAEQVGDWLEIRPVKQPYCNLLLSYYVPIISLPLLLWHQLNTGIISAISAIGITVAGFGLMTALWFRIASNSDKKRLFNSIDHAIFFFGVAIPTFILMLFVTSGLFLVMSSFIRQHIQASMDGRMEMAFVFVVFPILSFVFAWVLVAKIKGGLHSRPTRHTPFMLIIACAWGVGALALHTFWIPLQLYGYIMVTLAAGRYLSLRKADIILENKAKFI